MSRRHVIVLLLFGAIIGAGAYLHFSGAWGTLTGGGTSRLEQWCGNQLQRIANDLLRPELTFDTLDYQYPATAVLNDVRLIDGEHTVMQAASLTVKFTERPRVGQPVVIESVQLQSPIVRVMRGDDGALAGFSNLIESPEGTTHEDGGSSRPSEVFAIRTIELTNAELAYYEAGRPPMRLDGLSLVLANQPDEQPGWYDLSTKLSRPPVFDLAVNSRLNIDDMLVALDSTSLSTLLREDEYSVLPPSVQEVLSQHAVRGMLALNASGRIPLRDPAHAEIDFDLSIDDAHLEMGAFRTPVQELRVSGHTADGVLHLSPIEADVFSGSLYGEATVGLIGAGDTTLTINGSALRIAEALARGAENVPDYDGLLGLTATLQTVITDPLASLTGSGEVEVEKGTLLDGPIIGGLLGKIGLKPGKATRGQDTASASVTVRDRMVSLRDIRIVSNAMAARGDGEIDFDGRLNLRMNGGPLERLQSALGAIGEFFGELTDQLAMYHVTGRVTEPKIEVKPFRLGGTSGLEP